ncbi:hypothetical protein SADUNF_Sadunf02G0105300 [Salix dunnii]|uniref:BHLH domain-containing protein n=1 Tax=Salix dunnii TaxID=1413687 RepID=A0A835N746_9ROSI|nr:hypothetical protein SADUNF_Sadunf02G0105300 [Salix dunnii]
MQLLDCPLSGRTETECGAGAGKSGVNFSDPGGYYAVSSGVSKRRGVSVEDDLGDFSCDREKGAEAAEMQANAVRPRSSSKRSRAAEVHNLSEKTDKASMLDEAIEYLKQLQLQLQMLKMRNGLSLHPMCLPGAPQAMQLPLSGMSFDEGNGLLTTNTLIGIFYADEESSVQPALNLPSHCTNSNQPNAIPPGTNITSSETTFGNMQGMNTRGTTRDESNCEDLSIRCVLVLFLLFKYMINEIATNNSDPSSKYHRNCKWSSELLTFHPSPGGNGELRQKERQTKRIFGACRRL